MAMSELNVGAYKRVIASGNIKPNSGGALVGIFVANAAATPTITVYDDASTGTAITIVGTFTPVSGMWYPLPFAFTQGLNVVISGTVDATVSFV